MHSRLLQQCLIEHRVGLALVYDKLLRLLLLAI
jgi:hypothetical protein